VSDAHDFVRTVDIAGFGIIEYVLTPRDLASFAQLFTDDHHGGARHAGLAPRVIADLARHPALTEIAQQINGERSRLVRVMTFDKTPAANWFVPWHQDRTIAVAARADVPGYSQWTIKDGALHVEPPAAVLEQMITLRVHVDDCGADDGPLEAIEGSHRYGRLDKVAIEALSADGTQRLCLAARGDILAMRPLCVHRSQRARKPSRRRVLHLEYAATPLSAPLAWAL
jgi:Phytanoyl-CoA dioxygenase (PhyH)